MTQHSISLDSPILVRDVTGDYRPASADELLTQTPKSAPALLDERVHDHLIVVDNKLWLGRCQRPRR